MSKHAMDAGRSMLSCSGAERATQCSHFLALEASPRPSLAGKQQPIDGAARPSGPDEWDEARGMHDDSPRRESVVGGGMRACLHVLGACSEAAGSSNDPQPGTRSTVRAARVRARAATHRHSRSPRRIVRGVRYYRTPPRQPESLPNAMPNAMAAPQGKLQVPP